MRQIQRKRNLLQAVWEGLRLQKTLSCRRGNQVPWAGHRAKGKRQRTESASYGVLVLRTVAGEDAFALALEILSAATRNWAGQRLILNAMQALN